MIKERLHISRLIAFEIIGSISQEQLTQLNEWKAEDASHMAEYVMIRNSISEGLWQKQYQEIDTEAEWNSFLLRQAGRSGRWQSILNAASRPIFSLKFAAAAMLLLAGSILLYLLVKSPEVKPDFYTVVAAPMGSKTNVVLPDGSEVWLNSGSYISYSNSFNAGNRQVKLEGEAFFDVKAQEVPFLVTTSDINIRVLGTRFNVKAYSDDLAIETTLESGKVVIEKRKQQGPQFEEIVLKPNQKATFFREEEVVTLSQIDKKLDANAQAEVDLLPQRVISQVIVQQKKDIAAEIGWKDGVILVENEPLELLVRKLERRYGVDFVFRDEDLSSFKYSGRLKSLTLEQVLHALKLTSPIEYQIEDNKVILWVDPKQKSKYNQLINS